MGPNRMIFVNIGLNQQSEITEAKTATIRLISSDYGCYWEWVVSTENYQQIKSIYTVTSLVPVTLNLTINLNRNGLVIDNGSYLIEYTEDFLQFFKSHSNIKSEVEKSNCNCQFSFTPESDPDVFPLAVRLSVQGQMDMLLSNITEIKTKLETRDLDQDFLDTCFLFLNSFDHFRAMCTIYLFFVHPVLSHIETNKSFSHEMAERARIETSDLLAREDKLLQKVFMESYELRHGQLNWQ